METFTKRQTIIIEKWSKAELKTREMEREEERGCNRNAELVWGYAWDGVGSAYVV